MKMKTNKFLCEFVGGPEHGEHRMMESAPLEYIFPYRKRNGPILFNLDPITPQLVTSSSYVYQLREKILDISVYHFVGIRDL